MTTMTGYRMKKKTTMKMMTTMMMKLDTMKCDQTSLLFNMYYTRVVASEKTGLLRTFTVLSQ